MKYQLLDVHLYANINKTNFNMNITNASKEALIPLIIGIPGNIWKNRTGI